MPRSQPHSHRRERAQAHTLACRRARERFRDQVVVLGRELARRFGLSYTGSGMTLIALSVLVPPSASPLRSCPPLIQRLEAAVSAQRGG
jgi:hypothetical protein